jgi:hypothetical protein
VLDPVTSILDCLLQVPFSLQGGKQNTSTSTSEDSIDVDCHSSLHILSIKGRKSSPIWDYFAPLDPIFHSGSKNLMVCLVCRDDDVD